MATKEDFQKIVIEYNLIVSVKNKEEFRMTYAKLTGVDGFIMAWNEETKTILVADSVEKQKDKIFFYGANGYDDYNKARNKVINLLKSVKEVQVENRVDTIQSDFC